jgi:hypothetical protein
VGTIQPVTTSAPLAVLVGNMRSSASFRADTLLIM